MGTKFFHASQLLLVLRFLQMIFTQHNEATRPRERRCARKVEDVLDIVVKQVVNRHVGAMSFSQPKTGNPA